jgi:hypothetical protein
MLPQSKLRKLEHLASGTSGVTSFDGIARLTPDAPEAWNCSRYASARNEADIGVPASLSSATVAEKLGK